MSKTMKIVLVTLLLVVSLALSFGSGCAVGTSVPARTEVGLDMVKEAWGIIFQDYVDRDKLDASALSQAAIKGMVEELNDPYTAYLEPEAYQRWLTGLAGKYEGIGAYVGVKDEKIIIIAPVAGSPAAEAGIKAGDVILEIDGNSTAGMSLNEVVVNIRGLKGTSVRLLILHQGESQPQAIEIVRAEIKLVSVHFEMREDIAYLNLSYFSERTNEELSSVLGNIPREKAKGIVLDLRSNPGGLLEEVVDVASHFLKEGVVVQVVDNQGKRTSLSVKNVGITTDLPMVVLVDSYSASGSEVLSGALQDYARAVLAGKKTYGKGSVDTMHQLKDGSGLYLTTARWLTPEGRLIEGKGITPDYELELEGEEAIQWALDYLRKP